MPAWRGIWIALGTGLHVLTVLAVVLHCLRRRRESAPTLLWIFLAWGLPFFGALLYVMFGVDRVPHKGFRKRVKDERLLAARRAREDEALPLAYWRAVHEAGHCEPATALGRDVNQALNGIIEGHPLLCGNAVRLLVTGDAAYPAMLAAIRGARDHIHLQTFIVADDATGRAFLDALAERARAGVRIRLLYDRFGCTHALLAGLFRRYRHIPRLSIAGWTQANPLKAQFQVNLRNHRKIMIVDGREAFMGGINLHQENVARPSADAIRDYHVQIAGPSVQELQYTFLKDWYYMTDEDPAELLRQAYFPHVTPAGASAVRVISSGPSVEHEYIAEAFFMAIAAARRQALIVTPYFVPPRELVRLLRAAALRGVDVRLVVPARNNHRYVGMAARALYEELLKAGVRVFERRAPFMHAKALIVDDELAILGSSNWDSRSLRLNYETDLLVLDPAFAERCKAQAHAEFAEAEEIRLEAWGRRPIRQRWVENLCFLMSPVL